MSENRRKRFPWVRIIVLAVLIVVAAIAYYFAWGPGSVPVVRAARVARGNLQVELSATGIVKADEIQVASEVPARIERVAVKENEQVRRGQVLVVLDRESLQAYLRQARADLEAAQAQARQAQQGVRAEEANARATIEAAQANLQAAEAQLQRLETGARPQEIRTAEERVAQTQAQLGQTRSDLARLEQLYGDGAVSQQALDQARTAHELAGAEMRAAQESLRLVREGARSEDIAAGRAQVAAARAGVAQARALERVVDLRRREHDAATALEERARAQLSAAQAELSRAEITAPMDATVVRVNADPGEVAYPGAPLMVLSDLSHMWVDAEIDDVDLDKITLEQEVNVLAEAFPGRSFKGRVYEIAKSAEPKMLGRVRAKIVRAKVQLLEPAPLMAEMEVDVESRPVVARDALLVPNEALRREGDDRYVFVIEGNRVKRTAVRVGQRNYEHTEIIEGLKDGGTVALPGDHDLRDGQRVRTRAP